MPKRYFFSPDLSECAGCSRENRIASNTGTVVLEAPGKPLLHYILCSTCAARMARRDQSFIQGLEAALVARGHLLGAYANGGLATPKNWAKVK